MKIQKKSKSVKNNMCNFKGISLIVLVITIIIIIILASAIILTISNNNPVMEANKARYESDRASMQAIFTNVVAKVMSKNKSIMTVTPKQINTVINGVSQAPGEVSYKLEYAENAENTNGTIVFDKGDNTDTTFYTGKQLPIYAAGDTKWYVDSEGIISLEVAGVLYGERNTTEDDDTTSSSAPAQTVAQNAPAYYGKKVDYETGNETIDENVEWQVFFADDTNIYLTATDYVSIDMLPKAKKEGSSTEYALNKSGTYHAGFAQIVNSGVYSGSADIQDSYLKSLNSSYFEYLEKNNMTSGNNNMRAVAYMMDTDIWKAFAGPDAKYVIGGPTIEMLFESYNKKYGKSGINYKYRVTTDRGYQISADGTKWVDTYEKLLDPSDAQYLIGNSNAKGIWLASPSNYNPAFIMYLSSDGSILGCDNNGGNIGFRPVVCLGPDAALKPSKDGYEIE